MPPNQPIGSTTDFPIAPPLETKRVKSNVLTGKEAQDALMRGVDVVADAVKGTLGAQGYNAVLEHHLMPFAITTNDGVSVAKAIYLEDPFEMMGARLMQEIAQRSDKQSFDGTTTAITLAQAILHEGIKSGAAPMEIKRSLEDCLPLVEKHIKAQSKEIVGDNGGFDVALLEQVATISAEDAGIGATIAEIYQKIGKDGIIFRDISKTFSDTYTVGTGIRITDAGLASPYMADQDKDGRFTSGASYTNPHVLITQQKISSALELNDILAGLYQKEIKELVIFADDFEPQVVTDLIVTRMKQGFKTVLVKMPVIWKDQWFEDLALLTGATVVNTASGVSLKTLKMEHLGKCGNIVIGKDETYLDGVKDVSDHTKALQDGSDEDKVRAARLNTKTARYFVGAPSDQALAYRRLKVEDAVGSAWQALHGGIVPGGGVAFVNAAMLMPKTVGGEIMRKALEAPTRQIYANAGARVPDMFLYSGKDVGGFDARIGEEVGNMFDAGIVDATSVVLNSMRNALSTASTILSARVVVALPKEEKLNPSMPVL